jgi:hypothetical protein
MPHKEVIELKRPARLAAFLALAGVAAGLTAGCGPVKYEAKTGGSEEYQEKVKSGQPLYTPPKGAPGAPGGTTSTPMIPPPGPGGQTAPTAPGGGR